MYLVSISCPVSQYKISNSINSMQINKLHRHFLFIISLLFRMQTNHRSPANETVYFADKDNENHFQQFIGSKPRQTFAYFLCIFQKWRMKKNIYHMICIGCGMRREIEDFRLRFTRHTKSSVLMMHPSRQYIRAPAPRTLWPVRQVCRARYRDKNCQSGWVGTAI